MEVYSIQAQTINGQTVALSEFKGKVILVVNVASRCGFTAQYEGLESLYQKYKDQGFVILGFPCNQFGSQEPGSNEDIQNFCSTKFQVSFPMFSKIEVNGENAHPLFVYLKSHAKGFLGEAIKWNFTKFLIDRDGNVLDRYAPITPPKDIEKDILKALSKQ